MFCKANRYFLYAALLKIIVEIEKTPVLCAIDGSHLIVYLFSRFLDEKKRRFSEVQGAAEPGDPAATLWREVLAPPSPLHQPHQEIQQA